jgi:hypothetical protein
MDIAFALKAGMAAIAPLLCSPLVARTIARIMAFALLAFANAMLDSLALDANLPIRSRHVSTIVLDMEFAKTEIVSAFRRSLELIARMSVHASRIATVM